MPRLAPAAALLIAAALAGCSGGTDAPAETTTDPTTAAPTSEPTAGTATTAPAPEELPTGNETASNSTAQRDPEDTEASSPVQAPPPADGRHWQTSSFRATLPADTWLFVYQDLPGDGAMAPGDNLDLELSVDGEAAPGGAASHLVFKPFLVTAKREPETFFMESEALHDLSGKGWHYEPFFDRIHTFGDRPYHGIAFVGASSTPWTVSWSIEAPWEEGNGTVGPDVVEWGDGFTAQRLPEPEPSGAGGEHSELTWGQEFPPGVLGITAESGCYVESPCADAVAEEEWTFEFPRGVWSRTFSNTAATGSPPLGFFGLLSAPAGELSVDASIDGFVGERQVDVMHAPLDASVWPVELADASFLQ